MGGLRRNPPPRATPWTTRVGTADPLIPMAAANRSVPADAFHQPLWVTVSIPKDIAPGLYQGAIEMHANGLPTHSVPLRVRVYDFDLPFRPALQTVFWLNEGYITKWYGWDAIPPEMHREHMAFLLKYHISPGIGPKIMEPLEDFQFALDHGLNTIQLGNATSWPLPEATLVRMDEHYAYLARPTPCSIWPSSTPRTNPTRANTRTCGTRTHRIRQALPRPEARMPRPSRPRKASKAPWIPGSPPRTCTTKTP